MKKTERRYTKINSIKHMISLMYEKGDKTIFDYFDRNGAIQTISFTAFADKIKAFGTGLHRTGLSQKARCDHRRNLTEMVHCLSRNDRIRRRIHPDGQGACAS